MRILLFTGKGGVGKTTVAAATALQLAEQGYQTLIISTDPAHSLSDALDFQLGPEPVEVSENLWGQELDVYYSMKKYWGNIREMLLAVFRLQGVKNIVAEELSALPGMEEASAFLWIEKYYTEEAYDIIVIDSAPTGETLTLLTIPQVSQWWMGKALPFQGLQKMAIKSMGSMIRATTGIPLDSGYEELDNLYNKLQNVQEIFSDPDITSIRLVLNPEKMVINEAKRAYTYLQMYGYPVDAVIVNRILPEELSNTVFQKYIQSQQKYLTLINDSFLPLPIFKSPHLGEEVFGKKLLQKISSSIYQDVNPIDILHQDSPFIIEEKGNNFLVKVKLPFAEENEFTVQDFKGELVIQVANQRRNLFLPQFFNYYQMVDFFYKDAYLQILYEKKK